MDSNDRERCAEAREELMRMLSEDELRDAVLLVFANKQVSRQSRGYKQMYIITSVHRLQLFWFFFPLFLLTGPSKCDECSRTHRQDESALPA